MQLLDGLQLTGGMQLIKGQSAGSSLWQSISAGQGLAQRSAAIKTDGTLWLWDRNNYGTLGDNTSIGKSSPVNTIIVGGTWTTVSGGYRTTA